MSTRSQSRSCASWLQWLFHLFGLREPDPVTPPPPTPVTKKKWTFMVYIGGDNNLENAGRKDLAEMKAAGSTDQVNIIAQFDGMSDLGSQRYYLRQGTRLRDDVVEQLPEVNTGDPIALGEFLAWAQKSYPAERHALVLWNHGSGWKDDDIYRGIASKAMDPSALTRGQVRSLSAGNASRALFRSTLESVAEEALLRGRAILFDDTSSDFLDNVEMKRVLDEAAERSGRRLDLVGCDACLMSMLEVAYQLKSCCRYFVASQEEEPGDGWPYDAILKRLVANPEMTADLLSSVIVEEYNRFYRVRFPNLPVTQAALDLDRVDALADATDQLADVLRSSLETNWQSTSALISLAMYDVQRFADRDYVDLVHFCQLLSEGNPGSAIGEAASRVYALVKRDRLATPVLAEGHGGPGMRHVNGISVYVADRTVSPLYERLEFTKEHRWNEFLRARLSPRYRTRSSEGVLR